MSTIKSITPTMYNNQPDGGFDVVITDGSKEVKGSIGKKDTKSDKGLAVGEEVTYSENPWTSPKGNTVNFLTVKRASSAAPQPKGGKSNYSGQGTAQPSVLDMKFQARLKIIELACKGVFEGKLEGNEPKEFVAEWVSFADGLIDELAK